MIKRIVALSIIFVCTWGAWLVLSVVIDSRTNDTTPRVEGDVFHLWGGEHSQSAPTATVNWSTTKQVELTAAEKALYVEEAKQRWEKNPRNKKEAFEPPDTADLTKEITVPHEQVISLSSTRINVDLDVEHRKRGLLWFPTYTVNFASAYRIDNPVDADVVATVKFSFPSANAVYDNMAVVALAPGKTGASLPVKTKMASGQMQSTLNMPAKSSAVLRFGYKSRGMNVWTYNFGSNVEMVKHLDVTMTTNFDDYDFPIGTISPDKKEAIKDGMRFRWKKASLVSDLDIGMLMPERINPGPLARSMTLHAPVSLFFFFFMMFMIQVLKSLKIHPMNYFFIAASFFAFNLLFSYLVGNIPVGWAFAIASTVSIGLVVSYLGRVVNAKFALLQAGVSQFMFQVLFSVAHFLEGNTGLTVTIGAIVTLGVVMQMTARIDWEAVFKSNGFTGARKRFSKSEARAIENGE